MIRIPGFQIARAAAVTLSVLAGLGCSEVVDPDDLGPIPETWIPEVGTRLTFATSSCTLQLPDGTWRTYLPLGGTSRSLDGLTWQGVTKINLPESQTFNPAVA